MALANGGLHVGTDGNRLLYWPTAALGEWRGDLSVYMGYIRLIHFAAAMIFTVLLLGRIYWACVGNRYSRELFIVPVWRRSWWQGAFTVVRWYLFLEKNRERHRT